jgi:hypothetical protein
MDDAAAYSFRRELMPCDVGRQRFFQRYHLRRNRSGDGALTWRGALNSSRR